MSYFVNILGPIIYFFNGRVPIRLTESFFILKYFLEGMRNEQGRKLILNQQSLILEHINQGNLTIFKYNHLYEKTLFIFVFIGLLNVDTICYQRGKQLWPRIIEIVSQGRFDNEFMFRIWNKIQKGYQNPFWEFWDVLYRCNALLVVVWFCGFGAFLAANQRHYYYLESNNNNNIVVPYGLESTVFPYIRTFYVHTKVWFFFLFFYLEFC